VPPWMLAMTFLAALARGATPHPLVDAATALYQHDMPQACDIVRNLANSATGLTTDDRCRLELLGALRALDDGQDSVAHEGVARMLQVDPSAELPPFASKLRKMIEDARARGLAGSPLLDPATRDERDRKALAEREPEPTELLRAVDALYPQLQIPGALLVLDQASARPLSASDRARVALRRGILLEEQSQEADARAAFRAALEADPSVPLPEYAPEKTQGHFKEEATRAAARARPAAPAKVPTQPMSSGDDARRWGIVAGVGGLVLLAGAVTAGIVGLSSYRAEMAASTRGDYAAWLRSYGEVGTANNVADALYGAGAVALGVGIYLYVSAPGETSAGVGAGQPRALLVVGGHF